MELSTTFAFSINLAHLKHNDDYFKKQIQGKAISIFTANPIREEQDNCLSGLCRAFSFLEAGHSHMHAETKHCLTGFFVK